MTGDDDDHDLGGDDESLRGMRSVWLSMRDEEPSGRGMAELMAAARAQVKVTAPEPAWKRAWTAITELLRRPPVLALATIVVVAGTAALVTSRGALKSDEPPVASPSMAAPVAPPAGEGRAGALVLPDQTVTADRKEGVGAPEPEPVAATPRPAPAPTPKPAPRAPTKMAPQKPAPADDVRLSGKSAVGSFGAASDLPTDEDAGEAEAAKAPRQMPPPPPAAPAEAAPADPQAAAAHGTRAQASLGQLLRECQAAAARGDCPAVRTMVEHIRVRDAAFYRTTVAPDTTIAKCL